MLQNYYSNKNGLLFGRRKKKRNLAAWNWKRKWNYAGNKFESKIHMRKNRPLSFGDISMCGIVSPRCILHWWLRLFPLIPGKYEHSIDSHVHRYALLLLFQCIVFIHARAHSLCSLFLLNLKSLKSDSNLDPSNMKRKARKEWEKNNAYVNWIYWYVTK